MTAETTERRLLPVELTERELNARRDEAARLDGDLIKIGNEKKRVVEDFAAKADAISYALRTALKEIRERATEKEIECVWQKDYEGGVVRLIRRDTYETVEERKLMDYERQQQLALDRKAEEAAAKEEGEKKRGRKKGGKLIPLDGGKADAAAERKADREEMAAMEAKPEPKAPDVTVDDAVTQAARDAVMGKLPEDLGGDTASEAVAEIRRDGDTATRTYMSGPDGVDVPVNQAAKDHEAAKLQANDAEPSVDGTPIVPPPVRDEDLWTEKDQAAAPAAERAPALLKAPPRERKVKVVDGDGNPINVGDDGPGAA